MTDHDFKEMLNWKSEERLSHIRNLGSEWLENECQLLAPIKRSGDLMPDSVRSFMDAVPKHSTCLLPSLSKSDCESIFKGMVPDLWPTRTDNRPVCIDCSEIFNTEGRLWPHLPDSPNVNLASDFGADSRIEDFLPSILRFFDEAEVDGNKIFVSGPKFSTLSQEEKAVAEKKWSLKEARDEAHFDFTKQVEEQYGVNGSRHEFGHGRLGWRMVKAGIYPKDQRHQAAVAAFDGDFGHSIWNPSCWNISIGMFSLDASIAEVPVDWNLQKLAYDFYDDALEALEQYGLNPKAVFYGLQFLYSSDSGDEPVIPELYIDDDATSNQLYESFIANPRTWVFRENADIELIVGLGIFLSRSCQEAEIKFRDEEISEITKGDPNLSFTESRNAWLDLINVFNAYQSRSGWGRS